MFWWRAGLDPERYVWATYVVETSHDPERVATMLAQEQSAVSPNIPHTGRPVDADAFAARVVSVESLPDAPPSGIEHYALTPHESAPSQETRWARVEIAYPFPGSPASLTHVWTIIGAEVHRFGFVRALQIEDFRIPSSAAIRGPRFGVRGLRDVAGVFGRPLLCRSARPAVGATDDEMAEMAELVLLAGFDAVKDDELTLARGADAAARRARTVAKAVRNAEDQTGERKLYVANAIGSRSQTLAIANAAVANGADALLVSSALQGLEVCGELADEFGVPILCHNTWSDVLSRHPRFGVSDAALASLHRLSGADLVMAPGPFATQTAPSEAPFLDAVRGPVEGVRSAMPILAGGKIPEGVAQYLEAVGSPDFMLIVATAVDTHPEGMAVGAREFRDAVEAVRLPAPR
ncbi:hypothetical protein BSZ36_17815 [Rubricoccus marinus]|uniref:Ribulose bisphosphate carboxylase large subunit C-terminal domain-containing protein n=2 Tax=Rubricoccus marinus TaxID=716817 RepID=A0A259TUQ6_9BACT|nr:hypothetical protein BSZ36_17815 [Rubricoccus marinus]